MELDLSVVIVSYNAVDFLRICLHSVFAACHNLKAEVFVVDNNSADNSAEMVSQEFPQCHLIANKHNPGFSIANNQAIQIAQGKYILVLNPDTILAEDTLEKTLSFLNKNQNIGGLGIRMIDGTGQFLPESKRGLPTPWASFCKMSGLSSIFHKSKIFNQYHKGYIDSNSNAITEVLSGAFMCLKKAALEKTGLFDEDFFMYGEDIDLSYRLIKAGYDNFYFAESSIIHFKGESTNKDKIYRDRFYKAMVQFAQKHFSKSYGFVFSLLINTGINIIKFSSAVHRDKPTPRAGILNYYSIDSPINIENNIKTTPITEEGLADVTNGIIVFPIQKITYKKMIRIMTKYGPKFRYRFWLDEKKTLMGSDKKYHKGDVQHY
ncbi:glycosyltransferase family 2 protein [Plebeiibacterium marinum]|uniref:Glycosyltransferase family 2 protein n=1 Tax=Plebeiibacterium marinum TaxID=2992111 RepID=A0AAE3SJ36_9BACT|nr:glycosyltransferase family 2 protein [Plebeiobacterium marinum]MCW3805014.1 glycosyltransferase family 2 protein [Plebeiobacterium marinum]